MAYGKFAVYAGGAIGTILLGKIVSGFFKGAKQDAALIGIENKPAGQQAIRLQQAMNPSGQTWLMWGDGTDEKEVFAVAREIRSLSEVQRLYKSITRGRRLLEDLKGELDSDDFKKFINIVNGSIGDRIAAPKTEKPVFKYSENQKLYADGTNVKMYEVPDPNSYSYPMLETNALLGNVASRVQNRHGNWYGFAMKGKFLFAKEEEIRGR